MHQSSLGALMLLAGERVHPLWQTPFLPLLYIGAASFMSFGCVAGTTMLCCVLWKRGMDMEVLDDAAELTWWLIAGWLALRIVDIAARGALGTAFHFDRFAGVFWLETFLTAGGGWLLYRSIKDRNPRFMFLGYIVSSLGGMIYRFSPTTLAFRPNPEALYFPATVEILVSLGFVSLGVAGFLIAVKRLAILPAPLHRGTTWRATSDSDVRTSAGPATSSSETWARTKLIKNIPTDSRRYGKANHHRPDHPN